MQLGFYSFKYLLCNIKITIVLCSIHKIIRLKHDIAVLLKMVKMFYVKIIGALNLNFMFFIIVF